MNDQSHIIIANASSKVRKIPGKNGRPDLYFNEQSAAIAKAGEDFPLPFTITLGDDEKPYPPGKYLLDPVCLEVGDFHALKVGRRVKLIPVPAGK